MPVYNVNSVNIKRKERWYFGGLACCLVTFLVHPLDTIKVHLQTHQGKNISIFTVGKHIVHEGGVVALYNGLSASLMRQVVYSGTRFALYGSVRNALTQGGRIQSFWEKVAVAAGCGAIGACGATPFDLINVRMQNDIKLPPEQRRNYTWVGNAFVRLLREEGFKRAFGGASFVAVRGACMTVGQIAFYDTVKQAMLRTKYFNDTIGTHFASSIVAAFAATVLTQPLDVIKTRVMQAKPGELRGYIHAIIVTSHQGPTAFMKGMSPSALRIVPGTIVTFLLLEQLTINFGYIPEMSPEKSTEI